MFLIVSSSIVLSWKIYNNPNTVRIVSQGEEEGGMSVQQSDHSLTQKYAIIFAAIIVFGVEVLLLGLALIILAHYHERAYVFLGLGAAGVIGGIAGVIV